MQPRIDHMEELFEAIAFYNKIIKSVFNNTPKQYQQKELYYNFWKENQSQSSKYVLDLIRYKGHECWENLYSVIFQSDLNKCIEILKDGNVDYLICK